MIFERGPENQYVKISRGIFRACPFYKRRNQQKKEERICAMRNFIAQRADVLKPSGIRKVNEKALAMERAGEKVLHFEQGRPDFDTPAYIKEAAKKALDEGDVFYTSNFGTMQLREAIAEYLNTRKSCAYKAENILVTAGLSEAIYCVLASILDEGDEILVPDPVWMNYLNVPKMLGAKVVTYDLLEENDCQIDLAQLKSLVTPKTKAIVVVSPSNPTGGVLDAASLQAIADIATQNDLLVVTDEVYERLIYDGGKHVAMASLPGMAERTVTLNGFSKTYAMTGWRLGYVAANADLIKTFNKIHQISSVCAPSFVQTAGVVALKEEHGEVEEMLAEYQRRRDYAVKAINETPGLSCRVPGGAFYIFINIKELGISSADFCQRLLEEEKVAMVPGDVFGKNGEGYLRMSFANSYESVVAGCEGLKRMAAKLMNK